VSDFPISVNPKPIGGQVLVRMQGSSSMTAGGIHIPETVLSKPIQGKVEAVSQGVIKDGVMFPHEVHTGDVVIFNYKSGFDLTLDEAGKQIYYRIIHEKDIIAVLAGVNY
jgi:chaperonin GroES